MKEPNFFIVGAPKCGTTSLSQWLSKHPNIYMSPLKEPSYFNADLCKNSDRNWNEYLSLFENVDPLLHKAVGEASTAYLRSETAVRRIENNICSPKYIVMLRNPLDMVHSLHSQKLYEGEENITDFEVAWKAQTARQRGFQIPKSCPDSKQLQYWKSGCLGEQLERLYQTVDRHRVLVVFLEDVKEDVRGEWARVLEFLGVPYWDDLEFYPENRSKHWRWPWLQDLKRLYSVTVHRLGLRPLGWGVFRRVQRVAVRQASREPLSQSLRHELVDTFSEDIDRLAELTGRDLSHWKKVS